MVTPLMMAIKKHRGKDKFAIVGQYVPNWLYQQKLYQKLTTVIMEHQQQHVLRNVVIDDDPE